jgi:hypothetical protein
VGFAFVASLWNNGVSLKFGKVGKSNFMAVCIICYAILPMLASLAMHSHSEAQIKGEGFVMKTNGQRKN